MAFHIIPWSLVSVFTFEEAAVFCSLHELALGDQYLSALLGILRLSLSFSVDTSAPLFLYLLVTDFLSSQFYSESYKAKPELTAFLLLSLDWCQLFKFLLRPTVSSAFCACSLFICKDALTAPGGTSRKPAMG